MLYPAIEYAKVVAMLARSVRVGLQTPDARPIVPSERRGQAAAQESNPRHP
jgi:hypothetical protein